MYEPYYIKKLRIDEIHELGYMGEGIKIVIIDSGADYKHLELENKISYGINLTTENDNNYFDYKDNSGHGTGVLGEIVKIAPKSQIIIIKAMNKDGSGKLSDIIKALNFAISMKPNIINMSIGTKIHNSDIEKMINKAVENNISVVCAAGNDGDGESNTREFAYPAYYQSSISVGAMTKDCKPSFFSNTNGLIDLITFGEEIESIYPNDRYGTASGTSQACPIVTGVMALMLQFLREQNKEEIKEMDLYEYMIENTKSIRGVDKNSQGNGYLCLDKFIEDIKK